MIDDLGGATSSLVKLALDGAVMRHQVIANNIANANSEGFQAQKMSFEEHLSRIALHAPSAEADQVLKQEIEQLRDKLESGDYVEKAADQEVEIDMAMAELSANVLRYQALLEGLSKRSSLIKMAISGEVK